MENEKMEKAFDGFIDTLTEEQKEKLEECRTPEEVTAFAGKEGIELSEEMLDAIAGGNIPDHHISLNDCYLCSNCSDLMRNTYNTQGTLKLNKHYVCPTCGRDIWVSWIGTTGVTFEGRKVK